MLHCQRAPFNCVQGTVTRHIPVVERDRLVGIVLIGDIVKHRLWVMEQESREYHSEQLS
jgi:hypothetical protein